jgi:transposase
MDASRFPATMGGQVMEADMTFAMVAIDLGKQSFHLHSVSSDGVVLSRKVSRAKLFAAVIELAPLSIAMEACPGAHYWGRRFQEAGCHVRLIHPRFVKPFVRGAKNDAVDAEAIFEAASRPTMRFVPVKTTAQQDLQAIHRVRERLVCQRTSLINQARGLLAEYGIVLAKGPSRLAAEGPAAVADALLSDLARELFADLFDQLRNLEGRIGALDVRLVAICRENAASRRLATLPGVGPIIATALIASIDDGRHFRSGRELAAWIGLVPRQHTTGGKPKLGGIGRHANHYLRRQMIHGARSVAFRISGRDDYRSKWLQALIARRGFNRAVVALANKTARIAWALLTRQEIYKAA